MNEESPTVRAAIHAAVENEARFGRIEAVYEFIKAELDAIKALCTNNAVEAKQRGEAILSKQDLTNGKVLDLMKARSEDLDWRSTHTEMHISETKQLSMLWSERVASGVIRSVWSSQLKWLLTGVTTTSIVVGILIGLGII